LLKKLLFESITKSEAFPLLAFLIPLLVRAIPEILMGPYVVGFDTLGYYVPTTLLWLRNGVGLLEFVAVAPFFYVLLMGATSVGVPIVVSLKVMAPLLLGFLGLAVYFYACKTLSWSAKKSLFVALFATLYFVALRVSWDMLRSELALIFLFVTLIFLKKEGSPFRNGVLLSLAMLSVVFAHQLVAVVMFVIVLFTIIRFGFDRRLVDVRRLIVCAVPAAFLFSVIVYANYWVSPEFSVLSSFPEQASEGWITLFGFASYADMVTNTLSFLVFCYLPLLPLVVLGVGRVRSSLQLKAWIFWVFAALLSAFISPNAFVAAFPYRWILLLTFPLAFFAVEGFASLKLNWHKLAAGLMVGMFTVGFMFLPNDLAFPYFVLFPVYVPTSMLQNTIPLCDCQDTVNALQWAGNNLDGNASLLVHDVFYGWAALTLDESQLIHYGYDTPETVAQELVKDDLEHQLYLIWWVNGIEWHNEPAVSSVFGEVYESGRIAIFAYNAGAFDYALDSEHLISI
jgi:hypothetical protein